MNIDQSDRNNRVRTARSRTHLLLSKIARMRNQNDKADENLVRAWEFSPASDASTAMRFGNLALRRGENTRAIEAFTRASETEPHNPTALYKLGFALERSSDWELADQAYRRAQELSSSEGKIAFRRGRCLEKLGQNQDAVAQYHLAIRYGYRVAESYSLIYSNESHSPVWKKLETLRAGTEHHLSNFAWLSDRASLASKMGQHREAIEYFELAESIQPLSKRQRIDMARCHHELGDTGVADGLLRDLAESDHEHTGALGPGAYFKERGHWAEAIALFERKWNESSDSAQKARLEFEIGHAFDRQYLWHQAKDWFIRSLQTEGTHPYRHYRLGVVFERLNEFKDAYGPYARAIQLDPSKTHWWYRMGECAYKQGDLDLALSAYRLSTEGSIRSNDRTHVNEVESEGTRNDAVTELVRRLSVDYVAELDRHRQETFPTSIATWREALDLAQLYENEPAELVALSELHSRQSHLGTDDLSRFVELLISAGDRELAINVLRSTRDVRLPDGLNLKKYLSSPESRRRSLFAEFQKTLPIAPKTVLLESNHGSSIGCHPLALFREMSQDSRFKEFTYVWAVSSHARIPEEVASRPDVRIAVIHSDFYLKHLATAKYLINNVSFAPYFVRRTSQVYLNTWHGTPMKTLGKSMRQGILEYENLARNFVQATHVSSPNALTEWALFDDHRISRYAKASRCVTGSPRLDRLVSSGPELRSSVREQLGVDRNERVVLYAPTWRGGVSQQSFDTETLIEDLRVMADSPGTRVFFRAHRLTEKLVSEVRLPVEIVPMEIDTNDLLSAVDVLVTDYSSIAFDFLATRRELVFYVPDIEEYKQERGLYLEPTELPGVVCRNPRELVQALSGDQVINQVQYDKAVRKFAPMEDGRASRRTLDFMLKPDPQRDVDRPLLVFHASLIPNGIATALLALFRALDPGQVDIVLVVEGRVIAREEGRQQILKQLPDYVDLAFRVGNITATPEEQWAVNRDSNHDVQTSAPVTDLRRTAWEREARRVVGEANPTAAIEFDGYATLWADFVANLGGKNTRRLIWQHNQLVDEWKTKYPELAMVFDRYNEFDSIVPVAASLAVENRRALEAAGFASTSEYAAVPNVLDVEHIVSQAERAVDEDLSPWLASGHIQVVTIGRLSPEKNFRALIDAWGSVMEYIPNARLTVLGDGLLRAELQTRIEELGLGGSVLLAGQRLNPYPAIKRADLFVLPSVHEGQPVVVLEAMTLGVPVAAAFTPGTAELLDVGYGKLIGADPVTMARDLVDVLKNKSQAEGSFDAAEFRLKALQAFQDLAVNFK